MQRQSVRVIVASEYPQAREFLKEVVEQEEGAVIVGQAPDASKALTLARNLRPDAAIIDCYLPHVYGLDTIPLSRIGGLDTAQAISEEIPNTQVILLCNLNMKLLPEYSLTTDAIPFFSRERIGVNTPFKLQELYHEVVPPNGLVFANIEVKPRITPSQKGIGIADKAIFWGGLGILGGWFFILTMFLAPLGIFLALVGAATMFLGLAGKLTTRLRTKTSPNEKTKDKKAETKKLR